jgi:hypothetical protein
MPRYFFSPPATREQAWTILRSRTRPSVRPWRAGQRRASPCGKARGACTRAGSGPRPSRPRWRLRRHQPAVQLTQNRVALNRIRVPRQSARCLGRPGTLSAPLLCPVDYVAQSLELQSQLTEEPIKMLMARHCDWLNESKSVKMKLICAGEERPIL